MSATTVSSLLLILFAAVAVFHIITLIFGLERLRRISKVLLMPLLLGYYWLAAEHFLFVVLFAGLFGWVGDILLIKHRTGFFIMGLTGFLLGHLSYIKALLSFTERIDTIPLIIAIGAAIPLGVLLIRLIRPDKGMLLPVCLYAAALGTVCISAFCLMRYRGDTLGMMIFAGSLLFLASDTTLSYFTFRGALPRLGNLAVMATYIAAQAGISVGLAGV
jgi:uncharacterized membrane protein YhhN